MLAKSTCLHIPPLYEDGSARLMWESVNGADGYELDVHFDEDFVTASTGKAWSDIEMEGLNWGEIQARGMTWGEIEALPAQGFTWQNIEFEKLTWQQIEQKALTWAELQRLPVRFTIYKGVGEKTRGPDQGLTWANLDTAGLSWAEIQEKEWNWESLEFHSSVGVKGLSWESLQGRFLSWADIEVKGLSWSDLENLPPDDKTHIAVMVDIPLYKKKAIFRVRAYRGDEYSDYLVSPLINILRVPGTRITVGRKHCAVIKSKGTVWMWGDNTYGQLGDGTTNARNSESQVQKLSNISSIASGHSHTLALQSDGTVWSWGYNYSGQLGDGTYAVSTIPRQIAIASVSAISANAAFNLALKEDGTVWGWGYGGNGQLGISGGIRVKTPIRIDAISNVNAISAGGNHCLALKSDGTVWAWGDNTYGQLGTSTAINSNTPKQVPGLSGIIAISAGGYHNLALKSDGSVYAWGWNGEGELGIGSTEKIISTPKILPNLSNVTHIDAGSHHSIALLANDSVLGWGHNKNNQLGTSTNGDCIISIKIRELQDIYTAAAGYKKTIAIDWKGNMHSLGDL